MHIICLTGNVLSNMSSGRSEQQPQAAHKLSTRCHKVQRDSYKDWREFAATCCNLLQSVSLAWIRTPSRPGHEIWLLCLMPVLFSTMRLPLAYANYCRCPLLRRTTPHVPLPLCHRTSEFVGAVVSTWGRFSHFLGFVSFSFALRPVAVLRLASSKVELDLSKSWFWNAPQFGGKAINPLLWEG